MDIKKIVIISAFFLLIINLTVLGEEYKIGPGDVLEVSFWQNADLNASVRVGEDGQVSLDMIGSIQAAGKTTNQLQNDIVREMTRFDARISQATVRVSTFNFQHVFIKGQVLNPGKYAFESIPNLWNLINEAGGINEFGDLSRVTIIRGGDKAGEIEIVNVSQAVANGQIDKLPKIGRQDTIEIPRSLSNVPAAGFTAQQEKKNVIYVLGAVNTPGPIQYENNIDVIEALSLAGGPLENADMKKARIITKDGAFAQTMEINLEKYSQTGMPARYIMRKEDTFVLPHRREGFLGVSLTTAATVLGVITSALIVYTTIDNNNNNSTTR